MSTKPYSLAVFIGRFQPLHNGHVKTLKRAFEVADRVLVLVGSSNRARDTRNPFTFEERATMLNGAIRDIATAQAVDNFGDPAEVTTALNKLHRAVRIKPLADGADTAWIRDVQQAVKDATSNLIAPRVTLIGHERDETSAYLQWFPQWDYTPVPDTDGINATAIRDALLSMEWETAFAANRGIQALPIPSCVGAKLREFRKSDVWWDLKCERDAQASYREDWGDKEPHLTADAVVIQSGHVLMIRRGDYPGRGMLALPGGFKERGETLLQTACRELREETSLTLSNEVLTRSLYGSDVFDDPLRSRRGEIVTRAFFFKLPDGPLPAVAGADDAAEALWVPLNEIRFDATFEDHAFIIEKAITQLERTV